MSPSRGSKPNTGTTAAPAVAPDTSVNLQLFSAHEVSLNASFPALRFIPPVSLCLVTNTKSPKEMQRFLDNLPSWVSEIIIVSDNASEEVQKLALRKKAKIIPSPENCKTFGDRQELAFKNASHMWILWLDQDEIIPPKMADELESLLRENDPNLAAVDCKRATYWFGKAHTHGEGYPDKVIRLFKANSGSLSRERLHTHWEVEKGNVVTAAEHFLHRSLDYDGNFTSEVYQHLKRVVSYSAHYVATHKADSAKSDAIIAARAAWRFTRSYLLKKGYLDGATGLYEISLKTLECWTKHLKLNSSEAAVIEADKQILNLAQNQNPSSGNLLSSSNPLAITYKLLKKLYSNYQEERANVSALPRLYRAYLKTFAGLLPELKEKLSPPIPPFPS